MAQQHRPAARIRERFGSCSVVGHFDSPDHPKVFPGYSEFVPQAEIERRLNERGVLGICHAGETACTQIFEAALPRAKRVEVTLPVTFLGFSRAPESYVLYLQPAAGRTAF